MDSSNINGNIAVGVEPSEVETLQTQLRGEHEMYLRSVADFDNYRRRTERDTASMVQRGKRDLVLSFIEVIDSFERALQQASSAPAPLVEGLEATHRMTLAVLAGQGITPYNSVGETFDPVLHEAVASVTSVQYPPGVVVDELQHGYRAGDAVIRPARVRVSKQA